MFKCNICFLIIIFIQYITYSDYWGQAEKIDVTKPIVIAAKPNNEYSITPQGKGERIFGNFSGSGYTEGTIQANPSPSNSGNDAKAIQAAIDYCNTAKTGAIYIPAGHYRITKTLRNRNIHFKIFGEGELYADLPNSSDCILETGRVPACGYDQFEINGLKFNGTGNLFHKDNPTTWGNNNLVRITNSTRGKIINCNFYGGDTAIVFTPTYPDFSRNVNITITHCLFEAPYVSIGSPPFNGFGNSSYKNYTGADFLITNNHFMSREENDDILTQTHIGLTTQDGITISNNYFFRSSKNVYIRKGTKIIIANNKFFTGFDREWEGRNYGIYLQTVTHVQVSANYFCRAAVGIGIYNWPDNAEPIAGVGALISDNQFMQTLEKGIDLRNPIGVMIADNFIGMNDASLQAITIEDSDANGPWYVENVQITNNFCPNNWIEYYWPVDPSKIFFKPGMGTKGMRQKP